MTRASKLSKHTYPVTRVFYNVAWVYATGGVGTGEFCYSFTDRVSNVTVQFSRWTWRGSDSSSRAAAVHEDILLTGMTVEITVHLETGVEAKAEMSTDFPQSTGALSPIIPCAPKSSSRHFSSIESALSNPFPSKPSIVFQPRKPFYRQLNYSSWWLGIFLVLISSNLVNRVPRCKQKHCSGWDSLSIIILRRLWYRKRR